MVMQRDREGSNAVTQAKHVFLAVGLQSLGYAVAHAQVIKALLGVIGGEFIAISGRATIPRKQVVVCLRVCFAEVLGNSLVVVVKSLAQVAQHIAQGEAQEKGEINGQVTPGPLAAVGQVIFPAICQATIQAKHEYR